MRASRPFAATCCRSRAWAWRRCSLAVANGVFLYGLPARAATDYAWAIRPPINGALLGAGYVAGAVGTALSLRAERWRSMRILAGSLVTLAVALLAATALHADRFRWGYPPTWGWVLVYATVPLAAVALWRAQERLVPTPAADPRLATLRLLSLVFGVLLAVAGAALLLAPGTLADAWPWPLTPLMARAAAGWCLLVASALLIAARSLRRRHEAVVPYAAAPHMGGPPARAAGAARRRPARRPRRRPRDPRRHRGGARGAERVRAVARTRRAHLARPRRRPGWCRRRTVALDIAGGVTSGHSIVSVRTDLLVPARRSHERAFLSNARQFPGVPRSGASQMVHPRRGADRGAATGRPSYRCAGARRQRLQTRDCTRRPQPSAERCRRRRAPAAGGECRARRSPHPALAAGTGAPPDATSTAAISRRIRTGTSRIRRGRPSARPEGGR